MPVVPQTGLVTEVVRVLDAAGIDVDDIELRRPSLDDGLHALTRREGDPPPGIAAGATEPGPPGPPEDSRPSGAPTGERAA